MVLELKIKNLFFDRPAVLNRVKSGRVKALSKIGAFGRKYERSIMRRRKRVSRPGEPPSAHTGILKERIFFGYDPRTESVVFGPVKTNQVFFKGSGEPVKGTVPEVLDKGGSIHILEVFQYGKWQRADLRSRRRIADLPTRLRKVTIAPRPFSEPTLNHLRQSAKLEQAFKDIM